MTVFSIACIILYMLKRPLKNFATVGLFFLSSCSAGLFGFTTTSPITLTPNFESPTGWDNISGDPLEITIATSDINPNATLECRTGPKASIQSKAFSACTTSTLPVADVTQDSGTYQTEVRAIVNGVVLASKTLDYYVHPSLTGLGTCTPSKTDAQFFSAAGTYLNQSTTFGTGTD